MLSIGNTRNLQEEIMINAIVENSILRLYYEGVVSDSVRFLKIKFTFNSAWDGVAKTAIFEYGDNKYYVAMLDGNSMYLGDGVCYVPQEVIKHPGFYVCVCGSKNQTVITSSKESVNVEQSGGSNTLPADPTLSAWLQMSEIELKTKQIADSVRADADNGVFDGESGVGLPEGGTVGQIIVKSGNGDFETEWSYLDCYSKSQSDGKYVQKTVKINGHALSNDITLSSSDIGAYTKPDTGIPKSDLASDVKLSLSKADSALQSHQDISGKLNVSRVKTAKSSVSGDVYDVTYINSQIGDIEALLQALR